MMKLRPKLGALRSIKLSEWASASPSNESLLKGVSLNNDISAQRLAETLRSSVDLREGYDGLTVSTSSYVGRVDIGPLRISITPKLPALPLARLLRYAYGLRDLALSSETMTPTARCGLEDLLGAMLVAEVDELLHRGLARHYVPLQDELESPRGTVLIRELARNAGPTGPRLPCRYFEKRTDWHLNQILLSGVITAARVITDPSLRQRLYRCADRFGGIAPKPVLETRDLDLAERGLTRLTIASSSALSIIRLLHNMQGVVFEGAADLSMVPGFLFDMNVFFQRLLSRFLHDNLLMQRIEDEFVLRNAFAYAPDGNPKRRAVPKPRPDFGLFERGKLLGFLDAKYKDCWQRGVPTEWLYQASIYALVSPARLCVLLYASMSEDAQEERINIKQPVAWSGDPPASVIMRPVDLTKMAEFVGHAVSRETARARQEWAAQLVKLGSLSHVSTAKGNLRNAA